MCIKHTPTLLTPSAVQVPTSLIRPPYLARNWDHIRAIPVKSMGGRGGAEKMCVCVGGGVKRVIIPCRGVQNNASQYICVW